MKKTILMAALASMVLTACHNQAEYEKQPDANKAVSDAERLKYAEKTLGISIDKNQNWVLTEKATVSVKVDADIEGINKVAILTGNPMTGKTEMLTSVDATRGGTVSLSFRYPISTQLCYAACLTADGNGMARAFIPGVDTSVSFVETVEGREDPQLVSQLILTRGLAEGAETVSEPQYTQWTTPQFPDFQKEVHTFLPAGKNNRSAVAALNSHSLLVNQYGGPIRLTYIDGRQGNENTHLGYRMYLKDDPNTELGRFIITDNFQSGNFYTMDATVKPAQYTCKKMAMYYKRRNGTMTTQIPDNMVLEFFVVRDGNDLSDDMLRVVTFMVNGRTYLSLEDGDDNTFTDKMFYVEGATAVAAPIKPEPIGKQVWTYAWEDNTMAQDDYCDYDMNDCVIRVQENASDASKLDVTLVAVGGVRDLWLGFENRSAKSYEDYKPVFNKELHEVLGVPSSTIVNTGAGATAAPVTVTVSKPAGFDFQTNSFVLGAKVKKNMEGLFNNDYYMISIATNGQDPHGVAIPDGNWAWPTERTPITVAYPKFATWAQDMKAETDWYKYPASGKTIKVD